MRKTVGGVIDQLASKESGENQGLHGWLKVLDRVGGIIYHQERVTRPGK